MLPVAVGQRSRFDQDRVPAGQSLLPLSEVCSSLAACKENGARARAERERKVCERDKYDVSLSRRHILERAEIRGKKSAPTIVCGGKTVDLCRVGENGGRARVSAGRRASRLRACSFTALLAVIYFLFSISSNSSGNVVPYFISEMIDLD